MAIVRPIGPSNGNRLATRRVFLDAIGQGDIAIIHELLTDPLTGPKFRFRGRTPPAQYVNEHLWDGILAQWMVAAVSDRRRMGLVSIGSPDFQDGHAYLSALSAAYCQHSGLVMEGAGLALDFAFRTWPFRKIYIEASDDTLPLFAGALERFCVEEGRLREHSFRDGRYRDLIILAVYRTHWAKMVERFGGLRLES